MNEKKTSEKDRQRSIKDLNSYADTLRDASFLFEEKVEELSLLQRIGNIVGYIFDQEVFYRKFIDILMEETKAENCSFLLMDTDANRLVLKMARGRNDDGTFFEHPRDSGTIFSLGEGVAGKSALEGKTILINDVSDDKRFEKRPNCSPIGSLLCSPLIFQEKVLGVINLSNTRPHAFGENNKRVLALICTFVSAIIANAIAYIKIRDQEKFKAMYEGVRLSIMLLDPEAMKIIDCNRHTEEWLGYSKEELISTEDVFERFPPEHREKAQHIVRGIVAKNTSDFYELSFIKKDKSITIAEIHGTIISYQERKVIQLTIRDITEKKEMEKRLFRSEKLKALGELAGGVAHDFNNILAVILGRAQLLNKILESPAKSEGRKSVRNLKKSLAIIEKATLDGAETVRRIQEFSRRRGDDEYFTKVNLNQIVDDALEFTKVKWKHEPESRGIKIKVQKKTSSLPSIGGSASELREVMINLINNAVDAMPQGGQIKIKTFKKGRNACISLEDTGSGIPKAIRDSIFNPFFTTKGPQSNGLGMSVSYGIVERHRGTIKVDSVEGQGTTFTVKFPLPAKKGVRKGKKSKIHVSGIEEIQDVSY